MNGDKRFLLGFFLVGLSPILASTSAVFTAVAFAVGIGISVTTAFVQKNLQPGLIRTHEPNQTWALYVFSLNPFWGWYYSTGIVLLYTINPLTTLIRGYSEKKRWLQQNRQNIQNKIGRYCPVLHIFSLIISLVMNLFFGIIIFVKGCYLKIFFNGVAK